MTSFYNNMNAGRTHFGSPAKRMSPVHEARSQLDDDAHHTAEAEWEDESTQLADDDGEARVTDDIGYEERAGDSHDDELTARDEGDDDAHATLGGSAVEQEVADGQDDRAGGMELLAASFVEAEPASDRAEVEATGVAADAHPWTGASHSNFHDGNSSSRSDRLVGSPTFAVLEISSIVRDLPMRAVDPDTVKQYASSITSGAAFPPIQVYEELDAAGRTVTRLGNGQHRLEAYVSLGITRIEAEVRQGTRREAILAMAASNIDGLRLTNQAKRDVADMMFEQCPDWTDNKIAVWTGMSPQFILNRHKRYNSTHGIKPDAPRLSNRGRKPKVKEVEGPTDTTGDSATPSAMATNRWEETDRSPEDPDFDHETPSQLLQSPNDLVQLVDAGSAGRPDDLRFHDVTDTEHVAARKSEREKAEDGVTTGSGPVRAAAASQGWLWVLEPITRNLRSAVDKGAEKWTVEAALAEVIGTIWGEKEDARTEG